MNRFLEKNYFSTAQNAHVFRNFLRFTSPNSLREGETALFQTPDVSVWGMYRSAQLIPFGFTKKLYRMKSMNKNSVDQAMEFQRSHIRVRSETKKAFHSNKMKQKWEKHLACTSAVSPVWKTGSLTMTFVFACFNNWLNHCTDSSVWRTHWLLPVLVWQFRSFHKTSSNVEHIYSEVTVQCVWRYLICPPHFHPNQSFLRLRPSSHHMHMFIHVSPNQHLPCVQPLQLTVTLSSDYFSVSVSLTTITFF